MGDDITHHNKMNNSSRKKNNLLSTNMTTEEANFRNLGSSFGHAQFKINLLTYRMVVSCT